MVMTDVDDAAHDAEVIELLVEDVSAETELNDGCCAGSFGTAGTYGSFGGCLGSFSTFGTLGSACIEL